EGLALLDGGPLGPAEPEDAAAQAGHRALERKAGPSGRLEEQRGENFSIQGPRTPRADRDRHHLLRGLQDELDVRLREFADGEDVPPLEVRHQAPYSEVQLKECPPRRGRTYRAAASATAPTSRLRILPPQLGDVRGQDYDPAFRFHVPLPVRRVLLRLLRALDRDRRDDLLHDVVHVDAEDLAE